MSQHGFYLGLDLGQAADYTALALVENPCWIEPAWTSDIRSSLLNLGQSGWVLPSDLSPRQIAEVRWRAYDQDRSVKPPLQLRYLKRLPLATSYPAVVEQAQKLLAKPPLSQRDTALVIDYTGVGRPVFDLFGEAGLKPIGITITEGNETHLDASDYHVPKRDLVAAAQAVLQSGRLKVAAALPEAQTLRNELITFKIKVNLRGHDGYEAWREKDHDDLVLATSLAWIIHEGRSLT